MKLSRLTAGLGIYIVMSAAFMLQVNLWLASKVGNPFLYRSFWAASIIVLIAVLAHALRARLGMLRIFAVLSLFALAYILGTKQAYFEEKTHILMYGSLGFLAARDLALAGGMVKAKGVASAAAFVILISACDEGFQRILPYRFGDWGDFTANVLGGIMGIGLCLALKKREAL